MHDESVVCYSLGLAVSHFSYLQQHFRIQWPWRVYLGRQERQLAVRGLLTLTRGTLCQKSASEADKKSCQKWKCSQNGGRAEADDGVCVAAVGASAPAASSLSGAFCCLHLICSCSLSPGDDPLERIKARSCRACSFEREKRRLVHSPKNPLRPSSRGFYIVVCSSVCAY